MGSNWQPTRPRGPIAAMYHSPGPKYMVPGSTGHTQTFATGAKKHDPTRKLAPAYSFGVRHNKYSNDCSPGPGYLVPSNILRQGKDGTPHYSLYSRPKDITMFSTPGPGAYAPEKSGRSASRTAPAYSLSSRTRGFKFDNTPAPNAYSLPAVVGPKAVGKTSAPNYSLTSRQKIGSFHEDLQKTPGPGTYRVTDPNINRGRAPLYSMTGRNQMPGDTTKKPGPGAHSPEKVYQNAKRKQPEFSFGIRHSEYIAPLIVDPSY
ncbi:ciliary microtubule associated protein 1A-like isoform X1 [Branchiostoma floridae x Branchiostoma belcheri]